MAAGVFHMWGNPITNQCWVVGDTSKTLTVFDMSSFAVLGSRPTPADLGANAIPHDIVLDPDGSAAYVSIVNTSSATNDNVIKYSSVGPAFAEVDRASVGKAPHVGVSHTNNVLYVNNGDSDTTQVLLRSNLDPAAPTLAIDNAHGVAATEDGATLYVSTFPGTGASGLHAINTTTHALINSVNVTAGPHNVITSSDDTRLYITHSGGASTLVTAYDISGANRNAPVFLQNITVGLNPFGLIAVPAIPEPATLAAVALPLMLLARRR
jgi:DNA-binding beta-propeller fold protein YncE